MISPELETYLCVHPATQEKKLTLSLNSLPQGYERWEQNYYTMRDTALAALPFPVRLLVGQIGYRKMSSTLYGQGTGRLTPEEITKYKTEAWDHVNALLTASSRKRGSGAPDGMFFVLGGSRPTEADTSLFGFVASGLVCDA